MTRRIVIGTLIVAVAMAITGAVALAYVDHVTRTEAQNELFRQAQATGALVEAELADLDAAPGARIEVQLRKVRTDVNRILQRARVVGGHDVVEAVFVVRDRVFPLSRSQELIRQLPRGTAEREVVTVDVAGTEMFATVQRIPVANGEVVIAIGRTAPLLPLQALNRALLAAVAVGVILIVVLGLSMARSIRTRLAGLEAASAAIAEGDFDARAPVEGNDEIAAASIAFNTMADTLERARDRERQFLMNVGHDLRTPLTTIRGYAEALDDGAIDGDDMERVAAVLHAQTDRLSRLIDDVMLLARIEAREFTLRPEPIDVAAHIGEIVGTFERRADELGITIRYAAGEGRTVSLDPDRIGQICSNLIENALRYTPEGGTVTVAVDTAPDGVTIAVADSGPGIEEDDLDHVFDRFYVAGSYRPVRPEGSGLGLAIVAELTAAMGGTVEVTSTPGEGSRFVVRVPA